MSKSSAKTLMKTNKILSENVATVKKVKSKETTKAHQLFEAIAKGLVKDSSTKAKAQHEIYCRGLINKLFADLKLEIVAADAVKIDKITQLETKLNTLTTIVEENTFSLKEKVDKLQHDIQKYVADSGAELTKEREKRSSNTKKLLLHQEKAVVELKELIRVSSEQNKLLVNSLSEDLRLQSTELVTVKENFDNL